MAEILSCEQCGTQLVRYPSQIKAAKYGHFCDRHCLGKFRTAKLTGEFGANFKGGFSFDRQYVKVLAEWHPCKDRQGRVYLHRLIAESHLGRYLEPNEIVHHIDGNKNNNCWENLQVITQADHAYEHAFERQRRKDGTFA